MLHHDYFFLILITFGVYLMLQFYGMGGHFWRH